MEWISVKDRLPEIEQDVLICYLVTMPDDVIIQAQKVDYIHRITQYKNSKVVDWAEATDDICITHWMPLPPNPKD